MAGSKMSSVKKGTECFIPTTSSTA
jgi:hypothetical protein